jgi:predicted phage terminase large subunit-like protein
MDDRNASNKAWTPYKRITLASEYDPAMPHTPGDPRTQRGELLFPGKFPLEVIEAAKVQLGPYAFAAQHQQQPYPASGGILRTGAFRFWYPAGTVPPTPVTLTDDKGQTIPAPQIPLPDRFDMEALSWDMAFKDTHGSDFVCGQQWARVGARLFLLSQVHARLSFTDTLREFRAMCQVAPRALAKYVEDKANGSAVIDTLKSEIMGIVPVNPKGGKEARAHAASPAIEAGNVYLPHPSIAPWVRDVFLPEVAAFPRGKHDDQVDAMTQAINELALAGSDFMSRMTRM